MKKTNKIYRFKAILLSLLLFFSLLSLSNYGIVLADNENESGEIRERVVKEFDKEYIRDELIVKYKGDVEPFRIVKLPVGKSVREAEFEFESRGDVEYAEPNYVAHAFFIPNDPYYSFQWHMDNPIYGGIHTELAWDLSRGAGVNVAVVDTGVAYENYRNPKNGRRYYKAPDLASTCFVSGYDYVENDTHPNDDNSHGTHVAGTIGQNTDNGTGVAGVAFESCLMPVKVLDRSGSGTYANVAVGIRFAADNGAKVINLSLGGSASSQTLLEAVAYAYGKGVTVIAAAGNDGMNVISYPAAYDDYVMAVGATRYDETKVSYSNYGISLDLVAPGGDLTVDQNNDGYGDGVLQNTFNPNTKNTSSFGYWFFQGTSMAAPHVSGVAALVIAKGNATLPNDVRKALETTAEDLGTPGRDDTYGYGLISADAALSWTSAPPTPNSPPVANNQSVVTNEDTAVNIALTASDPDGNPLTYSIVSQPTNGTLSGVAPSVIYTPNANYNGSDSFAFKANDGKVDSNIATVLITINSVNDPPAANAGPDKSAAVDKSVTFDGSASFDPDGTITSYVWDFGDGTGGNGVTVSHIYTLVGTYVVTLSVTDDMGAVSQDTAQVVVSETPKLNIVIERIDTRDTSPGERYYVRAYVKNNESASYQVTGHLTITDPSGALVSWPRMEDKTTTISAGSTSSIKWGDTVPNSASEGIYTAKVDILYEGIILNSASQTFVLSRSADD